MRRITKIKITEQTEEPMVAPRRTLYGESFFFMAAIPLLLCSEPMSTIHKYHLGYVQIRTNRRAYVRHTTGFAR